MKFTSWKVFAALLIAMTVAFSGVMAYAADDNSDQAAVEQTQGQDQAQDQEQAQDQAQETAEDSAAQQQSSGTQE